MHVDGFVPVEPNCAAPTMLPDFVGTSLENANFGPDGSVWVPGMEEAFA